MPPLGPVSTTLACSRILAGGECGAPAEWHLSWYEAGQHALAWENSLCCQAHKDDAEKHWRVGWRHRILPACGIPGSFVAVATEGDDEDGYPLTYCYHPLDASALVTEAEEVTTAHLSQTA